MTLSTNSPHTHESKWSISNIDSRHINHVDGTDHCIISRELFRFVCTQLQPMRTTKAFTARSPRISSSRIKKKTTEELLCYKRIPAIKKNVAVAVLLTCPNPTVAFPLHLSICLVSIYGVPSPSSLKTDWIQRGQHLQCMVFFSSSSAAGGLYAGMIRTVDLRPHLETEHRLGHLEFGCAGMIRTVDSRSRWRRRVGVVGLDL